MMNAMNGNATNNTAIIFADILKRKENRQAEREAERLRREAEEARKEEEAKRQDINDLIDSLGIDVVMALLTKALAPEENVVQMDQMETENEVIDFGAVVEEARRNIPRSKYAIAWNTTKHAVASIEYDEQTKSAVEKTVAKFPVLNGVNYGSGNRKHYVNCPRLLCYIVENFNGDTEIIEQILRILVAAGYDNGRGILDKNVMPIYHTLILHYDKRNEIEKVAIDFLQKHDYTSFRVIANGDRAYQYRLNIGEKMILYFEREVCKAINEETKYMAA